MSSRFRDFWLVLRSIWKNLALFAALIFAAAGIMCWGRCFESRSFGELLVKAFYMTRVEGAMDGFRGSPLSVALVFIMPILGLLILGEGALRVAGLYINRKRNRGEWEKLMAHSLSNHIVICGAGELGRVLLSKLRERCPNTPIVVIDLHPDILPALGVKSPSIYGIHGDMTSHETLDEANIGACSTAIITSGNDAHNLEAAFRIMEINPKAEIHVRLYRTGLSGMMNQATYPNIHFFSPYDSGAEALLNTVCIKSD